MWPLGQSEGHLRAVLHLDGADLSELSVQNVLALHGKLAAFTVEVLLLEDSDPPLALPPLLHLLLRVHGCRPSLSVLSTQTGEGSNTRTHNVLNERQIAN